MTCPRATWARSFAGSCASSERGGPRRCPVSDSPASIPHARPGPPSPEQRALSEWQVARLTRTYSDLAANPRYRLAVDFFLSDIYGPRDFSERDREAELIFPIIQRVLPGRVVATVRLAMEMNVLAQELDEELLRELRDESGALPPITEARYAEAYRRCDNFARRRQQIELVHRVGEDLDAVVRRALVYQALRMARIPAHMAGLGALQDFLERGFRAFRYMREATEFLDTIFSREAGILERIVGGHPQPFDLELPQGDA